MNVIKEIRAQYHLTQRELANLIGYTDRQVSNWETNRIELKPETLALIMRTLKQEV